MKVELHLHTSRYSFCAMESPQRMMRRLVDLDYDAVFITEHDAIWSTAELEQLRAEFPQLAIFPGLERSVEGQHLLVLGAVDPKLLTMESIQDVLSAARKQDLPTILAHPFRWPEADRVLYESGAKPDAIELETCNQQGPDLLKAAAGAGALGMPTVNAGDAHSLDMLGRHWIETAGTFSNAPELRRILLEGRYRSVSAGA
jgi:predicted metal-dependent phosphoesterase TrpH